KPRPATRPASRSTPKERRQAAVEATSAPGERLVTRATPSATAFSSSARWETDLSPGRSRPPSRRRGLRTATVIGLPAPACAARLLEQLGQPRIVVVEVAPQARPRGLEAIQRLGDVGTVGARDPGVHLRLAGRQPGPVPKSGGGP